MKFYNWLIFIIITFYFFSFSLFPQSATNTKLANNGTRKSRLEHNTAAITSTGASGFSWENSSKGQPWFTAEQKCERCDWESLWTSRTLSESTLGRPTLSVTIVFLTGTYISLHALSIICFHFQCELHMIIQDISLSMFNETHHESFVHFQEMALVASTRCSNVFFS